jgi:phosphatidylinositol alpha-1,6-mannosyltransferase
MRVAFVVPSIRKASGWRSLSIGAIRSLRETANITPLVVVSCADAAEARSLFPDCELLVVPSTQSMSFQYPSSWLRFIKTYRAVKTSNLPSVDLVHSLEAYPTGLVGHWLATRLGVPHVLTAAGTYAVVWSESSLDRGFYSEVLARAGAICPISNGTGMLMQRHFADVMVNTSMRVVLLGTDYHRQVSRQIVAQRPASIVPTVLSVGAVKPRKGYHISLAAFAKVKKRLSSARYWIVGKPESSGYMARLRRFVVEHGINDVGFFGVVSDEKLRELYQQASVFLLTPQKEGLHFEGFGLVYLEAGAYGLSVVGTRTGGVPEAVRDGETGFLAEPEDVDGIADAVLRLLTDADLARRMGRANRDWSETLTWERYAREQCSIYEAVLNE